MTEPGKGVRPSEWRAGSEEAVPLAVHRAVGQKAWRTVVRHVWSGVDTAGWHNGGHHIRQTILEIAP